MYDTRYPERSETDGLGEPQERYSKTSLRVPSQKPDLVTSSNISLLCYFGLFISTVSGKKFIRSRNTIMLRM